MMISLLGLAFAANAATTPALEAPATCMPGADWRADIPAPPQRIHGNAWYVGTCGLSAILLAGDRGHILIDGGMASSVPLIEASIRQLGFRPEDVRYLLNSHGHFDHAGGLAALQRDTGATVVARGDDADAIERGRSTRSDPQFLSVDAFAPAENVRRIADGETLRLGTLAITAHATPGHTPGSTSWTWQSCDGDHCVRMVYADSLTALTDDEYRYGKHPDFLASMRASIARIGALPCDLLLTPHPDASQMWARLGPGAKSPLIDDGACRRYAERASRSLDARLVKEKPSPDSQQRKE